MFMCYLSLSLSSILTCLQKDPQPSKTLLLLAHIAVVWGRYLWMIITTLPEILARRVKLLDTAVSPFTICCRLRLAAEAQAVEHRLSHVLVSSECQVMTMLSFQYTSCAAPKSMSLYACFSRGVARLAHLL